MVAALDPLPTQRCTTCRLAKPATLEFFYARGGGDPSLMKRCIECHGKKMARHYRTHRVERKAYTKAYADAKRATGEYQAYWRRLAATGRKNPAWVKRRREIQRAYWSRLGPQKRRQRAAQLREKRRARKEAMRARLGLQAISVPVYRMMCVLEAAKKNWFTPLELRVRATIQYRTQRRLIVRLEKLGMIERSVAGIRLKARAR